MRFVSKRRPSLPRFRPQLEELESRLSPATLTVNTTADNTTSDAFLTLREAILVVNAGTNAGVIPGLGRALSAGEQGQINTTQPFGTNDTIQFSVTGTILLGSNLPQLTRSVSILGPGAASLSVDGNAHQFQPFNIAAAATVTLSGLTITNGGTAGNGGGISNSGTLTVQNSTISGNTAGGGGGGIYNIGTALTHGTLTVQNSILSGNMAGGGGGIFNGAIATLQTCSLTGNSTPNGNGGGIAEYGTLTVQNCTVSGNLAKQGGGIDTIAVTGSGPTTILNTSLMGNVATSQGGGIFNAGMLTLQNSPLSGNSVTSQGGGFFNVGNGGGIFNNVSADLTLQNSPLTGNMATNQGGGIFNGGGIVIMQSDTLSGDSATNQGGGICNGGLLMMQNSTLSGNTARAGGGFTNIAAGQPTLRYCTLSGNSASGSGGGIYSAGGTFGMVDTIIAGNMAPTGPDIDGLLASEGDNLIGNSKDASGFISTDMLNVPAGLDPNGLQNNGGPTQTIALLPGSLAIDAGGPIGIGIDERGITRPQGSAPDIGAFESRGFTLTITDGNNQMAAAGQSFAVPLSVSVSSPFGEPVAGGVVTFTGPSSSASINPRNVTATLNASGQASATVTANGIAGPYQVTASASGATSSVAFSLRNTGGIKSIIAVGAGAGGGPVVNVYDSTGALKVSFNAFAASFTGGVRVAVGDVNGDGMPDIICGAGPGGGPEVRVFDGKTFQMIRDFQALPVQFTGGVFVAAGDVNGDGFADIITAADAGGGPQVTITSGKDGSQLASFYATTPSFTGGIRVAAGDLSGTGFADVIAAAGPGGGPQVTIFDGKSLSLLTAFYALPSTFTGGMFIAAGDVNSDGKADIIVGAEKGGGPEVNVFNNLTQQSLYAFFALPSSFTGGVRVGFTPNFNGRPGILTAAGPGGGPEVSITDGGTQAMLGAFFAFAPTFGGGLFVAGG